MRRSAVITVLLAAGALAVPSGQRTEHRCAAYCLTAEPNKFSYTPGQTYQYSLRSTVRTDLQEDQHEISALEVTAQADIVANSACDLTLRLRDVTLKESDPKDEDNRQTVEDMSTFKEELERHPLSFSYQDGRVEELCAARTESVWALNFKRGLLSAIVNNMVSLERNEADKYEMDVSGYCATGYTRLPTDEVNSTLILRRKDLRTCRERGRLISSLQTVPYHSASKVQSPPLLQSSQECWQTVSAGRIRYVFCSEMHKFQPFSRGLTGARSLVTLELAETGVVPSQLSRAEGTQTTRENIMFDHSAPTLTAESSAGDMQNLVSELERLSIDDVRPEVPHLFSRLVATLRHVGVDDLRLVLRDGSGRPRRYILDALPMLGTAAGITLMQEIMLDGLVATEQSDRWMTSLALAQEPSLAMVEAVAPIVGFQNVSSQTLLGASAMVHHFCSRDDDCARHEVVTRIVKNIEALLGDNCGAVTREDRARVLAALKALGNVGILVDGSTVLPSCYKNQEDIEIRLAAIRAYRRTNCETIADSGLMSTLANQRENTEIRIAAYLSIMQCPTHGVVDKLLELLGKESVNQVGSFIWTHITNMQESNDPGKDYIKSLLYNAELVKKFNTDARKFSRYYEKTLFFESVNAGGAVEGAVIFSPDSYIPRSGMLNLTVDLFGDSINLLEVGGRIEGVEKYIEQLVTNGGSHPQTALGKMLNTIRGSDSSNDINRLSNLYMKANGDADVFSASTYAKIFGNELHFANYENVDEIVRSIQGDNPLSFLKTLGRERDWSENYQFLDSSYTVPTIAGFPLTLNAVGSTAVTIKTGGAFTFESWSKMRAEGYIKPSAAVEIVGGMEVDAHVAKTGLKMTANLHTSTALDGHAVIDSGKLISIKVNMPRDKVEFFDLKTDFHRVFRNQDRVLKLNPSDFMLNSYGDCSHPYIGDPLGIRACFSMSYPLPREPSPGRLFRILGPIRATLLMEKTDPSIDAFTLDYTNNNHDGVMQSSLTFDTPGGRQNRRVSLSYMLDIPEKAFHVEFVSPIKSLELSGGIQLTGTEKFANVQLRLDDREVFGVKGSLTTDDSAAAVRLRPKLVVRGTSGPLFSISGNLNMNKAKHKYAVDLAISDLYENPVTLSGRIDENNGTYTLTTSMDSYALKGSVLGACRFVKNEIQFMSHTKYSVFDGPQHTIAFNTKMWEEVEEAQHAYMAVLNTKFSALPVLDSELSLKVTNAARRLGGRAFLLHGQNEYQLSAELSNQRGQRSGMVAFKADHLDVDFKVALELGTRSKQKFEMNALAQLSQDRSVRGGLIVDYLSESYDFNYGIHTYVALMNSNYSLSTSISRDTDSLDFAFLASRLRSSRAESKSISLTAQLAVSPSAGRSLDITLQLPGYPTTRLIGQLTSGGSGGRYLASGELRHGARTYLTSVEYRYTDQHEVELQAHLPNRRYSGTLAARTERGNVKLKADLRLGRRIMSVVSLRPGPLETSVNFELFWNKDIDDSQHILLDFKKTKSEIESRLRYPGRDIKLAARQTPEGGYAELELSPGQTIFVEGSVRMQEDGRLSATLDVRTPFPGYTEMVLTYTNRPDLTDERSLLNFQVAGHIEDKEIVLDGRLVINFDAVQGISRTKGNNLKAELNLRTPFAGWERSQLVANYLQGAHGVTALLSASKNGEVVAFGVTFEKLQVQEFFSINTAIDFALPVDRVRKGKLGFVLVLEESHLLSNTTVEWTGEDTKQLSMNVQCRYTMTPDLLVDSHVTFKTPFENMEQLDTHLHVGKTKQKLVTSFRVLRNAAEELFGTYLGGTKDYRSGFFSGEFDFACASCPGFGVALEYKPAVDASSFNLTTYWKDHKSELTGATSSIEGGGREYSLTLLLPNPNRRYALKNVFRADIDENTFSNHWEVSRDNQTVKIGISSAWNIESHTDNSSSYILKSNAMMTSPFLGWESAKVTQLGTLHTSDSVLDIKSSMILLKENKNIAVENTVQFYNWASWIYRHDITGNTGWFSKIEDLIKLDLQSSSKKAIYKTTWDGQTAKATLVDNLAQDGDYEMFMTAQWFGQPERRLSLIMPATAAAWSPSLTVLYAPGKTIKLQGRIAHISPAAESHVTIDTPFTDVLVLKTEHDLQGKTKYAITELLHGNDKYNLQVKVDVNSPLEVFSSLEFSSPPRFFGSGSLGFSYQLDNIFTLKAEASHNSREVALAGIFGHRGGSVTIVTPFPGFTKLSLAYTLVPNELRLLLSHEQSTSSATFSDKSDRDALKYSARLITPYQGFELLTVSFVKPRGESFSIDYYRNRHLEVSVAGSHGLSGLQSYVQLEILTPYCVLRYVKLEFSYNLPKPHVKLLISKGDDIVHTLKFEASANFSLEDSTMHVDYQNSGIIFGPRSIILTATYDVKDFEKRLRMQLLDNNKTFSVDGKAQLSAASSYLMINVDSPIPGYETLSVSSKALSLPGGPKLTFELLKNNQKLGADFQINLGGLTGDAVFEITTPFASSRHTLLSAKYRLQGNPAEFELMIERDSVRKTITGSVELSYTERSRCQETSLIVDPNDSRPRPCTEVTLDASLLTPFHGLEKFTAKGAASVVNTTSQAQLILNCDRKQIKAEAFGQLGWSGSEVSLHITTPLPSLQTVGLNAGYDVGGQVKNASVSLFHNGQHFKWLTSGAVQSGAASGYVAIFTPFAAWKSVKYSAMYDLNQAEKQIDISYERNGKKQSFAVRGMFDSGSVSMSAVTPFEGFESLGIGGQYVNNRVKREIGYDAHINHDRHRLYVLYEREGRNNVKLRLNTPIHGLHSVEIDLRRQSFSDGHGIYLDVNADGKRSSAEIRTSLSKTIMGIDVDFKSGWELIEDVRLSGSVNLAKRKKAFRLKSESKKQKIELSGFYALSKKGGVGKLVSKLPIPGLEKVNVKVKVVTGKKNKLTLMYTAGGKKKKINGDLTFTGDEFLVNLKTPYNGFQRIKANAGRTKGKDGKVSAELSLKRDNREISVKYQYIFSMKSGDGSIDIATPYEGFEDMRMSLAYNNSAKERNMNFSARRNSRQWSIETSRSWATGTDETSLILSSPIEFIRSLKVIRSFDIKNLAAMTYHASYERNNRKFVISGKGSILKKGKTGTLDVNVNTPLEVGQLNANVAYDFSSGKNSLNAGITAGAKYVKLSTSLRVPSGSIKLTTSHPRLPSVDIDYNALISELSRDVSATVTLADGRKLLVRHNMARRPDGRDASIRIESSTFGNREFSWSYTVVRRGNRLERIALSGEYDSPNVGGSFDASAVGLSSLSLIKVDGTFLISSAYLTKKIEFASTVDLSGSPNVDATALLTVDGREYKLVVNREQQRGKRILNIVFDGQRIQSLKVTGESTAERLSLEGERSITISYGSGTDEVSILGKVNLGSSAKSGSLEVQLRKPSGGRTGNKEVDLKTTWNFIEPNREIQADISVDGRNYLAKLVGSRQTRSANYVLVVSGPSIRVSRQKFISEAMVELSYDLNDGVEVKVRMDKPLDGKAEVAFKKSQSETTLKTSLGLNDNMDLSPRIGNHQLAVDYKRMKTPTGSRFEISVDTTAFSLGKIDVSADVQRTSSKSTVNINYKRGTKTARVSGELSRSEGSGSSSFKLTTPIVGFEDVSLSGSYSYTPGQHYALNIDYSRGGKHFRLDGSSTLSIKKAKGKLKSVSSQTAVTISSLITKPVELSYTADINVKDVGTRKQSATGEVEGSLNGKKVSINYKVDRDEHGRRIANVVLTTPLKNPYKKIVLSTDVSLHSNRAEIAYQAGSRKASAEVSWFAGEAGQYGAELSLSTPYDAFKSFELEVRGTRNRDNSIDVLGHYQRNGKIVHVTGTVHQQAIDLIIEVPWGESYRVEGGFKFIPPARIYSVRGLITSLKEGRSAGGEITVKATALKDMQFTIDLQTPLEAWRRINADIAYTASDEPFSRVIRVAFESPLMKRTEVSFELTNRSDRGTTNLRAGTTINYQSFVFTFWTHIFRDSSGMKYELELESPYHINLPLLAANH